MKMKWKLGFFAAVIVAATAMPATAGMVAAYECDSLNTIGTAVYTPDSVGGWGDAQIATSGGLGMAVVNDPVRGNVLQIQRNDSGIMHGYIDPLAATESFTVMCWINTPADAPLIRKMEGWTGTYFQITTGSDFRIENDSRQVQSAAGIITYGDWMHYAVTAVRTSPTSLEAHLFLDGVEVASITDNEIETLDPADAGKYLMFGNQISKTQATLGMLVDDYFWFDEVLLEEDIQGYMVNGLAPDRIPGDANEDGSVDVSDLGILATNYGAGSGFGWGDADFTGDGFVDVSDLGILATNYGISSSSASVPEPSILAALVGLALAGLAIRRR